MPQATVAELGLVLSAWIGQLSVFGLVLMRVCGLLAVGPLLGHSLLPWPARAGLAVVLSVLITPLVSVADGSTAELVAFAPAVVTEFGVGFVLGCGSLLILGAIPLAGRLLDQQHALPSDDEDDAPLGSSLARWSVLVATGCFLVCSPINGAVQAVLLLADSFRSLPLGSATTLLSADVAAKLLQQSSQLALLLLAPALATLVLMNLAFGLLGAAGFPGVAHTLGPSTRPVIAAIVLMASLSGLQQHVSVFVRQSLTVFEPLVSAER